MGGVRPLFRCWHSWELTLRWPLDSVVALSFREVPLILPEPTTGKTDWFVHDRFGLFIHWGLYALPARHEWVSNFEEIGPEAYRKYFEHFNPDLFDPKAWAKAA